MRHCATSSTASERGARVIEDHQIDVELPPRGIRSLLVNALEIRDEPLATRKILVTIDDITERKRASEALEAARRMAEQANLGKSRFLAAASHDLRQPLQTLSLLRGILAKRIKDQSGSRLVAKFEETLSAMSGMLNTLLDINQLEAGIVRPEIVEFPIGTLLDRLKTEFAYHATAKQLDWRVVASSLNVRSDPRLLEQTLRNLLANAVKYTERGKVLLGCRRRGNKLRIEVWDSGFGIPAEQLEAIFEEFHQLDNAARERSRGLGLGLSIVQRISDLLGNAVDVRSWPDRGSVFAVEVPLGEDQQLAPQHSAKAGGDRRPHRRDPDRRGRSRGARDAGDSVRGRGAPNDCRRRRKRGACTGGAGSLAVGRHHHRRLQPAGRSDRCRGRHTAARDACVAKYRRSS